MFHPMLLRGSALILSLSLSTGAAWATPGDYFDCGPLGDGSYRVAIDPANTDRAEAVFVMGADAGGGTSEPIPMAVAPTGSGFRYAGGPLELRGQGMEAELRVEDMVLVCSHVIPGDPAAGQFPVRARSFGGNARSGPGMEYNRIGGFAEGEDLIIVRNTGVMMNGYPWFEVRDMEGAGGFHWGGIMCATERPVDGIFPSCDLGGNGQGGRPAQAGGGQRAQSFGGNVRSGPGMEYGRLRSFVQGDDLIILRNTGVMMNGYPWFEVQDMQGRTGFHWGGIMCAAYGPVDGIFPTCQM